MIWDGLTAKGVTPPITQAQTEHLPNLPYAIDDPMGFNLPFAITTREAWHRLYQNQMQINAVGRTTGSSPGPILARWLWVKFLQKRKLQRGTMMSLGSRSVLGSPLI